MQPTDILMQEHKAILQVLACLERLAAEAETSGRIDTARASQAVTFFRDFADRCHHGKEEAHLFPMMESAGFPPDAGPTAVMRIEHDEGRGYVRAMAKAIEAPTSGPESLKHFTSNARLYVALLRQHIAKEDECLFAMANDALGPREQQELMELFRKVEEEETAKGTHARCLAIANQLAEELGVEKTAAGSAPAATRNAATHTSPDRR